MTKFLIILLVFIVGAVVGFMFVIRKFKNFLSSFAPNVEKKPEKEQVVFKKDDIVVLKGEAKKGDSK